MLVIPSLLIFTLIISSWIFRNYENTGKLIFSTKGGITFSMANNDSSDICYSCKSIKGMTEIDINQSETQRDSIHTKAAANWILKNPGKFILLYGQRILGFWSPISNMDQWYKPIITGYNFFLLFLGLWAFAFYPGHWKSVLPIVCIFAVFTSVYGLSLMATRFRIPLYPDLEILASVGLITMLNQGRDLISKHQLVKSKRSKMNPTG
jgi:hypothetical protein